MSDEIWDFFKERERQRKMSAQKSREYFSDHYWERLRDGGWECHSETHYSFRMPGGERFHYWPGPKKTGWLRRYRHHASHLDAVEYARQVYQQDTTDEERLT